MFSGTNCVMLTLSDLNISANSAAPGQLCICRYLLPDSPLISWLFSSVSPALPHFFHITPCLCLLSEDAAVNAISDGGWGKPWPKALRTFQPFLLFGEVTKWGWHSVGQGRRQKAEQAFLCLLGHWSQQLKQRPISWHSHYKKESKSLSLAALNSTDVFICLPKQRHGAYIFVPSRINEYTNNADSMNYSNPPATMLVGVEANQLRQETHTGKSNKASNNLGGSAITLV